MRTITAVSKGIHCGGLFLRLLQLEGLQFAEEGGREREREREREKPQTASRSRQASIPRNRNSPTASLSPSLFLTRKTKRPFRLFVPHSSSICLACGGAASFLSVAFLVHYLPFWLQPPFPFLHPLCKFNEQDWRKEGKGPPGVVRTSYRAEAMEGERSTLPGFRQTRLSSHDDGE